MTHLKISLLLIVCVSSALDGKAQTGITLTNELNGKWIGVIGDSYVRDHKELLENTQHYKFAKRHGAEYFNYEKSGSSIAYSDPQWEKVMYLRYAEMAGSLDYVIVIGGHNGTFKLDPIGGIDNFKDKMEILHKGLVEKYPTTKTFLFACRNCKNFKGNGSKKVVDAMIEVYGNYSIPIFDCAGKKSIYADNDTFRRTCSQKSKNNIDTAHPNSKGYNHSLKVTESFLL